MSKPVFVLFLQQYGLHSLFCTTLDLSNNHLFFEIGQKWPRVKSFDSKLATGRNWPRLKLNLGQKCLRSETVHVKNDKG